MNKNKFRKVKEIEYIGTFQEQWATSSKKKTCMEFYQEI